MSDHTPEPWTRTATGSVRGPGTAQYVTTCGVEVGQAVRTANARRLVAAVNAVAGIATEALEQGAVAKLILAAGVVLDGLNARIDSATIVRGSVPLFEGLAELHAALAAIRPEKGACP